LRSGTHAISGVPEGDELDTTRSIGI